jgi:hypothetical protein
MTAVTEAVNKYATDGHQQAFDLANTALARIDGVRRTWRDMQEPGETGYGLVSYIANVPAWDQTSSVHYMIGSTPYFLPAFIKWRAPTEAELGHWSSSVPFVIANGIDFVGSEADECDWPSMSFNSIGCGCDHMMDLGADYAEEHGFAIPLWHVFPIEGHQFTEWRHKTVSHWSRFAELAEIPYSRMDVQYHRPVDDCGENDSGICPADDESMVHGECECGLYDDIATLQHGIYKGTYFPRSMGDSFAAVWEQSVGRMTLGWSELSATASHERNSCLSSFVSLCSPLRSM